MKPRTVNILLDLSSKIKPLQAIIVEEVSHTLANLTKKYVHMVLHPLLSNL